MWPITVVQEGERLLGVFSGQDRPELANSGKVMPARSGFGVS
jgi:hypothetical protein